MISKSVQVEWLRSPGTVFLPCRFPQLSKFVLGLGQYPIPASVVIEFLKEPLRDPFLFVVRQLGHPI